MDARTRADDDRMLAALARTAVFGVMRADARRALLPHLRWRNLAGGETLFARGDASSAMYVLCSGSLGAFEPASAEGDERLLGHVAPGETVGELGLLTRRPHSVTLRALRDCTLLELRDGELALGALASHPDALAASLRLILERLARRDSGTLLTPPRTFALLPAEPSLPTRATAEALARALEPYGSTLVLGAALGAGRGAAWLAEREHEHRFVLFVADGDASWRATCQRQADQFLLLARADTPRDWPDSLCRGGIDALHRVRRLLLLGGEANPAPGRTRAWLSRFDGPLAWHHLRDAADHERVARHMAGRAVGLVLSGGGARGLGHLGVVRALRELRIPIDAVGGTSMGAIIAAGVACEWDDARMLARMREAVELGHPLSDLTLPLIALTRGARTTRLLRRTFENRRIEDLALPFFCVSANLTRGGLDVHDRGVLWKWLRAGAAIPGILPPLLDSGMVHVDGAVMNNLPTDVMRATGVGEIIAVDTAGSDHLPASFEDAALPTLPRLTWDWLHGRQWPSLFAILVRAAMVHSESGTEARRALATHLLTPPPATAGLLHWKALQAATDSAYRYTMDHFERRGRALRPAPLDP